MKASELKQIAKSIESHRRKDKQIALAGIKKFVEESPSQVTVKGLLLSLGANTSTLFATGLEPENKNTSIILDNADLDILIDIIENLSKNV